ncbi:NYN domain-containing protein [Erythrobacteraceae bacterium E2-1 Yellow Sea]|nr:NYN domain-containing protein [Erythrobacteraceae bacterium E2-1 Yellow Sea]
MRAGIYVDGYNLYHAIEKLGEPWLKWVCLWKLGEKIALKERARLVRAVFCTAVPNHTSDGSKERHMLYNAALRARGVEVIAGHHVWDDDRKKHSEKQSDINVALSLICDAEDDKVDVAILLSADSDQAATARFFADRHSQKRLILAAPPGKPVPQKATPFCSDHFVISKMMIDECALPALIQGKASAISRPTAYTPPDWWKHPDERPQK